MIIDLILLAFGILLILDYERASRVGLDRQVDIFKIFDLSNKSYNNSHVLKVTKWITLIGGLMLILSGILGLVGLF